MNLASDFVLLPRNEAAFEGLRLLFMGKSLQVKTLD